MEKQRAQNVILEASIRLLSTGLTSGSWGNISQRIDQEYFAITPGDRDYRALAANDIIIQKINTMRNSSSFRLYSEIELHAEIYRLRPDIKTIIHTHSLYACIICAARKEIPCLSTEMQESIGNTLPVIKHVISGSKRIVKNTITALKNSRAVLLANHGAICVGENMDSAIKTCEIMEQSCKSYLAKDQGV